MSDRIEKSVDLQAPVARVWRALTDHREFGEWFRVRLEGPFQVGEVARGQITHPGYEHVVWQARVQQIDPERLFSFTWHPYGIDANVDYSKETPTLVEFRLEATPTGTRLTITESGFDRVPSDRRAEAFRMNDQGWTQQVVNIARHVR
jgi:uncharacterized protein YndB with AHSA1/START domain